MSLADLYNRHPGRTAWIVGTGPSLDRLNPPLPRRIEGRWRIYLNRAAMAFPVEAKDRGLAYVFTLDDNWGRKEAGDWDGLLAGIRSGQSGLTGVWPRRLYALDGFADAPTGRNIITYTGPPESVGPTGGNRCDPRLLKMRREEVVAEDRLYSFCGSAMTAIHLAWVMGATAIVLAGIDGTDGYARVARPHYGADARGGFGYGQCKVSALETAQALGLAVRDLCGESVEQTEQGETG